MSAVTFDFGQTLAELDLDMLRRRVAERGATLSLERAGEATAFAWEEYNAVKRAGLEHREAWCVLMQTLLERADVPAVEARGLAEWLWDEQPRKNLWRKPIAGMFELCEELRARGVPIAIVSNSEGHLGELAAELGIDRLFGVIADSGALGFEKPDRRIFEWTAERLSVPVEEIVHVGDAWEADVVGALRVGARAVWFSAEARSELPAGVAVASNAARVRAALSSFGAI